MLALFGIAWGMHGRYYFLRPFLPEASDISLSFYLLIWMDIRSALPALLAQSECCHVIRWSAGSSTHWDGILRFKRLPVNMRYGMFCYARRLRAFFRFCFRHMI
jgi:hypothetical protein